MFRNSRGPDTQGVSMSIPPDVEPIINDYHQLLLLALNGTGRYITLGPIVAPQTGFNIPNDKDILYASRLNQYLAWCTHASNQTNRLGLLILLSAVFDQITQKDTKPRALLAGIIAHSFVQIKKTEGSSRKIFQSPVFSTKSLLIYNDLNHIYHTYGEADKDTKNYRAEMVGNILAASCMQYSEDTQHAIKKEARKIHKKLGGPLKIFSTDLPSVFSMPPPQILCDKPAEKDSLAATALTPTIVKHPVHSEPIIMDYEKLLRFAKEGATAYLTNGKDVAIAKGLNVPNEIDIIRASRFMNYLDWCYQAADGHYLINQPAVLVLLLAIFGTEAGHSKLLAHIITRQCIVGDYKCGHNMFENTLKSEVFSKQALSDLISDDTAELFNRIYDKKDKDKFHDILNHPMAFRRLLNLLLMQHSENDRLIIQQNAEKLKGTLKNVNREIQPNDLPGVCPDPTRPIAPYYKLYKQSYTEKLKNEKLVENPAQVTEEHPGVRLR